MVKDVSLSKNHRVGQCKLFENQAKTCECLPSFSMDMIGRRPCCTVIFGSGPSEGTIIYDLALYFGDRKSDAVTTELFGKFGDSFLTTAPENFTGDTGQLVRRPR